MANQEKKAQQAAISGIERAAILLLSIGEQSAAEVLKLIDPREVHKVSAAMAGLKNVTTDVANSVLLDFIETVDNQTAYGVGSQDYLRNVLIKALGEDKAGNIIDRGLMAESSSGLEQLKWMDARSIFEIVRLEHPQLIAVVLSYLDSEQASEVLGLLPERLRADVLLRIAVLDRLQPTALQELNRVIEEQFLGNSAVKSSGIGGVKIAANILNFMDTSLESTIMEQITEYNPDLAEKIQDLMFVFDNLIDISDRGIQSLLREVSSETLVLAMKGADQALKEKIYKNMSKRAAEMLRDDLEAKGPVRLSEVEAAQKEILAIARRLAESGDIVLGGKGAEEYV